jgi:hypothetical protein
MPRRNTFIPPQQKRPAVQPLRNCAAGRWCPKPSRAKFSPITHRDRQMISIAASTRESRRGAPDEHATAQLFSAIVLITAQKTRLLTAVAQASTVVTVVRKQRTGSLVLHKVGLPALGGEAYFALAWNDCYGEDSSPFRGDKTRRAFRPFETFLVALTDDRPDPEPGLKDRSHERAVSARKRSWGAARAPPNTGLFLRGVSHDRGVR